MSLGKAAGLIATSNIQHATPAAYSSHWHDRGNCNEIAEQQAAVLDPLKRATRTGEGIELLMTADTPPSP